MDLIAEPRQQYANKLITLSGYIVATIKILELESLNIPWLANEMGVRYTSLRDCILKLRAQGLITIPTVDPRKVI